MYVFFVLSCVILMAGVDLLSVIVFGTTASLRVVGLAVVNGAGDPASRLRMVWRTVLAWAPGLGTGVAAIPLSGGTLSPVWVAVMVTSAAIFVVGLIWTVMRPGRGLQDLLSGSHIVPR